LQEVLLIKIILTIIINILLLKLNGDDMQNSESKTPRGSVVFIKRCLSMIIFLSVFFLFSCEREDMFTFADNGIKSGLYAIGDTGPGGGIVFYVTGGGLHGLEAAPVNQGTAQTWIEPTVCQSTANGNTSISIGTGPANTSAIISQASHTSSAAQLCADYYSGNCDDWFLPSKDELHLMYLNLASAGLGGFATSGYWSSSEYDLNQAWNENFNDGTQYNYSKNSFSYVRAVRAF